MSALLWVITWPSGKLRVYVDAIKLYDAQMSSSCLIGPSLTASRHSRGRRDQDQIASINGHPTKNKIQLNAMITDSILNPCYFTEATQTHTLTIAGVRDVPVEITGGLRIDRHGLYSTHEEADILIAQHAISYLLLGKYVRVVCDDRDVFVLLFHYYNSRCKGSISAPNDYAITSEGTSSDRYSFHRVITQ